MNRRRASSHYWTGGGLSDLIVVLIVLLMPTRVPAAPDDQPRSAATQQSEPSDASASESATTSTSPADLLTREAENESCEPREVADGVADRPLLLARSYLEAARCILVRQCSAPLSAELAGSDEARPTLASRAAAGLAMLDRAAAALRDAPADADDVRRLSDRADMLRAFGAMFEALGRADSSEESAKHLIAACNALAVYQDDADERIVESAKLWQGVAYRRAGRPERSLQVLRPIITAPIARRIGFLARLERCRALGDTGNHAAGIALSQRLSARVESWFAGETAATRAQAADAARMVRAELFRDWASKLRAAGDNADADRANAKAEKVIGPDTSPLPSDRRLALGESIAGTEQREQEPATQATSQPDTDD